MARRHNYHVIQEWLGSSSFAVHDAAADAALAALTATADAALTATADAALIATADAALTATTASIQSVFCWVVYRWGQ